MTTPKHGNVFCGYISDKEYRLRKNEVLRMQERKQQKWLKGEGRGELEGRKS